MSTVLGKLMLSLRTLKHFKSNYRSARSALVNIAASGAVDATVFGRLSALADTAARRHRITGRNFADDLAWKPDISRSGRRRRP